MSRESPRLIRRNDPSVHPVSRDIEELTPVGVGYAERTMKLPNWFRVAWWLGISAVVTIFLWNRYPELVAGHAVPADIVVFVIWIALLLVPIFREIELFGLKFRQEVEKIKEELKSEIHSVRAELRNAVDVRTTFNPQITFPAPPPDSQLPDLEARIRSAVAEALNSHGVKQPQPIAADLAIADDIQFLFAVRHAIERELRRIAQEHAIISTRRMTGMPLARTLTQTGVIEQSLEQAIREVYAVASPAIHAEDVSQAQVSFVRDVGPSLVAALRAIRQSAPVMSLS